MENLEVDRKKFIRSGMMGWKKRLLRILGRIRSREQEDEETDLVMEMRFLKVMGEK